MRNKNKKKFNNAVWKGLIGGPLFQFSIFNFHFFHYFNI